MSGRFQSVKIWKIWKNRSALSMKKKNRARIMEHHQQMGSYESGHACEAVCSWIKQKVFVRRTYKMSRFLKDTKKYYKYAIYSAKSKLQSEVASSYLNWLWWVLDPICFMLIYTLIFGVVFNAKEQYFTVFIFIGLTMWDFFNKTLQQSVKSSKTTSPLWQKYICRNTFWLWSACL